MNTKTCLNCHLEVQNLKHCSRCRIAGYCSRECQKEAYSDHRKLCKAMSQLLPELQDQASLLSQRCASNPTLPFGVYTWTYIRYIMCNNAFKQVWDAPEEVKDNLRRLKTVACVEGNLEAAREYVRAEWIYRHKYAVLLEDSSVVDLPLMLLALGRGSEAENVIKKVFMYFLEVEPLPVNPPSEFFSMDRLVEASRKFQGPQVNRHPSMFFVPVESFLLLMCFGAYKVTHNRPAFQAASDTVYDEIFNEESFFNKLQGKDAVVEKILGKLERDTVTQLLKWAEQHATAVRMNEYVLQGIVDPASVLDDQSDWTAAYKKAFWSENLPPKWLDFRNSLQSEDQAFRQCAKWILLGAMPICRLAGIYDTLREIASKVLAA